MKTTQTASTRAKNRAKTLETDFRKVHNDKYSYENFTYHSAREKSTIGCPIHGNFEQCANDHLNGYGCPTCGRETVGKAKRKPLKDFVGEAITKHGNFIDYSNVDYKNTNTPVTLICPHHGVFSQAPCVHLAAVYPCPLCALEKRGFTARNTTESFVEKARKVHLDTYSYSNVVCATTNDKVAITCEIHGDFLQTQSNHLAGNGCPICGQSGFKENLPAILYYVSVNDGEAYKIGITNRTIKERFRKDFLKLKVLGCVHFLKGVDARETETKILKEFKEFKYNGPDLLETGNSELFNKDILKLNRKRNE